MKKYASEYRKKTVVELEKEKINLKSEISKLKIEWGVNKPKDTNIISNKLKKLAVLLTILSEKIAIDKLEIKK